MMQKQNINKKEIQFTGNEKFTNFGKELDLSLLNFWQWNYLNLDNNEIQYNLAKFLVGSVLGSSYERNLHHYPYDYCLSNGVKIIVKQALLSKHIEQKKGVIEFTVDNLFSQIVKSNKIAIFIFSVYDEINVDKIDFLCLDNWKFYVISRNKFYDFFHNGTSKISLDDLLILDVRQCSFKTLWKGITREIKYCK